MVPLTNSLTELHPLAITDYVAKENHTIDWQGVKFPARDTGWTARGVKEAVEIRKTGTHAMNRDGGRHQLPSLYSKFLVKTTLPFMTNGKTRQQL